MTARTTAGLVVIMALAGAMPTALAGAGAPGGGPSGADTGVARIAAQQAVSPPITRHGPGADFGQQTASAEVEHVAHWAMGAGDAGGKPFIIIDKVNARAFVFDAAGKLRGSDRVLLGMGVGDTAIQGIGDLRLAAIRPQDRVTPAGRFVASLDRDLKGQEILWIDYDNALALHRVIKGQPSERRAQRLAGDNAAERRITFGCINVPVGFYEDVVSPTLRTTGGIVYILPESRPASEVFGSFDMAPGRDR